jgi:hypothetical protein
MFDVSIYNISIPSVVVLQEIKQHTFRPSRARSNDGRSLGPNEGRTQALIYSFSATTAHNRHDHFSFGRSPLKVYFLFKFKRSTSYF